MAAGAHWILVKGDLGLGNRILCLLSAILLARITGRRLLIDWRDSMYAAAGVDAFASLLSCDLADPLDALPATESIAPPVWRGHLHDSAAAMREAMHGSGANDPFLWRRFSIALDRIHYPEEVLVFTSYFEQIDPLRRYLAGELGALRPLPTDAILRDLWTSHLRLAPELAARVDDFARRHMADETLGVHVRASDLVTRVAAIERAVASEVARRPGLAIFLATDNVAVLQRYRELFARVVAIDKWYPEPGAPLHRFARCPDPAAAAADALIDLHLLARCDGLIADSRSSFARLAMLRSTAIPDRIRDLHLGRFVPLPLRRRLLGLTEGVRHWWRGPVREPPG